ncbi:MAG TPA: hypothetical protein PLW50_09525 [Smithellaceae bacterium]|nr:hypothetical protein [Smithellaceae bacterium]
MKGPIVQSSSLAHQFRNVQKLQKDSPNPMMTSATPTAFNGVGFVNIAECPNTRSTQTAIANNTRLMDIPIGPTPNKLFSLLMAIKRLFESMLAVFKQSIQHTPHKMKRRAFLMPVCLHCFYRLSTANLPRRLGEGGHEIVILILKVSPPEILP